MRNWSKKLDEAVLRCNESSPRKYFRRTIA